MANPFGMFILEEKEGHVEERKRGHQENDITVSGGTKKVELNYISSLSALCSLSQL